MSTTVKTGWLKDNNGEKFAPKTLISQVQTNDGTLFEEKIQADLDTMLDTAKSYTDQKTNGLASTSSVNTSISTHNTSTAAHNDIRDLITGLTNRLNTLANSDDITLDQMSEIVAYIKNNKSLIDGVTTSKVNVSDIINNLTTNVTNKPLSAAQGVAIKTLIDDLETVVDGKATKATSLSGYGITNAYTKTEVDSKLDAKSDSGHGHNYYGVCSTAAATVAKTVNITGFKLEVGAMVIVKFIEANSASNPTLDVSGTGAKPMCRYGTTALSTGTTTTGWYAGSVQVFVYDGTSWIRDYWNNSTYSNVGLGQGYTTCSTAAATKAKTASLSSYALSNGGIVAVKFTYAVPADATLNVNGKGAKPMYYAGAAITGDIIKAGDTATFMYESANGRYHLLAVDRWQKDINDIVTNFDSALENHENDNVKHITSAERTDWNIAKEHADSTHIGRVGSGTGAEEFGSSTTASGKYSHAEGVQTTASGYTSHAEGNYAVASGSKSHAECLSTTASGDASHAEGRSTTASGDNSHAEGQSTEAIGQDSHAEGNAVFCSSSNMSGEANATTYSVEWPDHFRQGDVVKYNDNYAKVISVDKDNKTVSLSKTLSSSALDASVWIPHCAFGKASHAEGLNTTASGDGSHAEGEHSVAGGSASHAEGNDTTASGDYSHAEGLGTTASKQSSHAEGELTTASGLYSHAEGYMTKAIGDRSHAECCGSSFAKLTISGDANATTYTIISVSMLESEDINVGHIIQCGENYAKITAYNPTASTITVDKTLSVNEALANTVVSVCDGVAYGNSSHAEGDRTTASGVISHAEGQKTIASYWYSHAEGQLTTASGMASHAEGSNTKASGDYSHAEGYMTTASKRYSHAEGSGTTASGDQSHAEGLGVTARRRSQHAQGEYNILDTIGNDSNRGTYAHIVGNGTADNARSNAHTLDWSGNAWFAGDVYVGSTSGTNKDSGSKILATQDYVDTKISEVSTSTKVLYAGKIKVSKRGSVSDFELSSHLVGGAKYEITLNGITYYDVAREYEDGYFELGAPWSEDTGEYDYSYYPFSIDYEMNKTLASSSATMETSFTSSSSQTMDCIIKECVDKLSVELLPDGVPFISEEETVIWCYRNTSKLATVSLAIKSIVPIERNKEYTITVDDISISGVPTYNDDYGDFAIWTEGYDDTSNKNAFIVLVYDDGSADIEWPNSAAAYKTITISTKATASRQIDESLVPDTIARMSDIPHYNVSETPILAETTVEFSPNNGYFNDSVTLTAPLVLGKTYKVVFDGMTYIVDAQDNGYDQTVIGNKEFFEYGINDTGEPFAVTSYQDGSCEIITEEFYANNISGDDDGTSTYTHTISISEYSEDIKYVPEECIPDSIKSAILPPVTEADNGKVLMVVNGKWQLVTLNLTVDENGVVSM